MEVKNKYGEREKMELEYDLLLDETSNLAVSEDVDIQ